MSIRIECETCNKLINAHTYKNHLKTCGQSDDCRFCGKKYSSQYYRQRHELTHNKNYIRPSLTCSDCNANFSAISTLNIHKKKCFQMMERRNRLKTVVLQPYKRVAKAFVPKQEDLVLDELAAKVVHLPDEDIAAVETITSDTEYRNETSAADDIDENWRKVVIETVPQFPYVNSKNFVNKN